MNCPGFERLIDYVDGRLSGVTLAAVERHLLSDCAQCSAEIDWYKNFKQIGAKAATVDAPPWVLKRAVRLFEGKSSSWPARNRVAGAVARLIFDSFKQAAPAGARSAAPADRQLLYQVEDFSIDLQIGGLEEAGALLKGQVLDAARAGFDTVAGIPINLAHRGKQVRSTLTNDIGEFAISGVENGEYDLMIDTRDMTVNIVGLELKAS